MRVLLGSCHVLVAVSVMRSTTESRCSGDRWMYRAEMMMDLWPREFLNLFDRRSRHRQPIASQEHNLLHNPKMTRDTYKKNVILSFLIADR
jgi:hypothetical protein